MPNIILTRIVNRLVHGQVATQWCGAIGANLILVANDEVAGNKLRQGLMDMAKGKRQVAGSVAVDDKDVAAFAKLRDLGVELEIRRVPTEGTESIEKLFK